MISPTLMTIVNTLVAAESISSPGLAPELRIITVTSTWVPQQNSKSTHTQILSHHLPANTQYSLLLPISVNSIRVQARPNPETWNLSMTPCAFMSKPALLPVLPPSHHLHLYFTLSSFFLVFKS